jgi:hypothetical protein
MIYFATSHLVVAVALFIVACLILYYLDSIRGELRRLREALEHFARAAMRQPGFPRLTHHGQFRYGFRCTNHHGRFMRNSHHGHRGKARHFAIWIWRGECWELDPDSIPPGIDPGRPPDSAGTYRDQCVKTLCP